MKTAHTDKTARQGGMSLIELMIAMVIGMVIIAGVMYVFQGSNKTYRYSETMSRMQENGRLALETLGNDIRLTSFAGCRSMSDLDYNTTVPDSLVVFNGDTAIAGAVDGSNDKITLKHMSESGAKLSQDMANESSPLIFADTPTSPKFVVGDIASMADCTSMDTFVVSAVVTVPGSTITVSHDTPENTQAALTTAYGPMKGRITHMIEQTYYIKDTGRTNAAGQAIPGLYRRATLNSVATAAAEEELAEGIVSMKITYGLDSANKDGQIDEYVATSAMGATQWAQIVSVRVEFLVASVEDNILDTPQPYTFNGSTTTPTDKKLRTSVGSTVTLRNRTP